MKKSTKIILVVIALLVIGGTIYYFMAYKPKADADAKTKSDADAQAVIDASAKEVHATKSDVPVQEVAPVEVKTTKAMSKVPVEIMDAVIVKNP